MAVSFGARKLAAPLVALALLAPGLAQALPEGLSEADLDAFRAGMVAAGCEIRSQSQAQIVEAATGFGEAKLGSLTDYLLGTGELAVTPAGDGIALNNAECGEEDNDDN